MQLDEPLSDKEFKELDQFLLSDRCAEDGMTMDSLHGYLTALAIGPEMIMMSEWLPLVWGEKKVAPKFKNNKEGERIVGLIARYMNEIAITLEVAPKEYEPLFCELEWEGRSILDGEAWAMGFWTGMHLHEGTWDPIYASNIAPLMRPFYLMGADEIEDTEETLVDDPVKRHKLAVEIEAAVPEIYRFWLPQRKSSISTVMRESPKVGRNDDCPCGSGKKFKKCCGAEPVLH
jgi:uncharacterized protein